jgi:hypothetical protein
LYTADALILRTYKLGEADRIVVFLTRDRGKKRGVAKGARRQRSRFVGTLEPLTEARVVYFEKERRELVGLNFAETIRSPLQLIGQASSRRQGPDGRAAGEKGPNAGHYGENDCVEKGAADDGVAAVSDIGPHARVGAASNYVRERSDSRASEIDRDALGYVGYFAELLDEWAQEADADERLYRLGVATLTALAAGAPVEPLARYFEYWLLRLQGLYPDSTGTLSAPAVAFLTASRSVTPERIGEVPSDRGALRELEQLHRTLIAMHLEKTLKSDRVLRELRRHD